MGKFLRQQHYPLLPICLFFHSDFFGAPSDIQCNFLPLIPTRKSFQQIQGNQLLKTESDLYSRANSETFIERMARLLH